MWSQEETQKLTFFWSRDVVEGGEVKPLEQDPELSQSEERKNTQNPVFPNNVAQNRGMATRADLQRHGSQVG